MTKFELLLEEKVNELIEKTFENYNLSELSFLEKRFLIFDYLSKLLIYDVDVLENKIKNGVGINPIETMSNTLQNNIGVCNSFVMFYKFILEKLGIPSIACVCNYSSIEHQHKTLLVKDMRNNTYSFDDVTMIVLGQETYETVFGYSLEEAAQLNMPQLEMFANPSSIFDELYKMPVANTDEIIIEQFINTPVGISTFEVVQFPAIQSISLNEKLYLKNKLQSQKKK